MNANRAEKPTDKLVDNLVLPYGEWEGHPMGPESYGPTEGRTMLAYFERTAKATGRPIVIDYEHQSLDGGEAPAAGWIWDLYENLEADPPGIYMRNEWTPRAAEMIKGGEYRYISPVVAPNYTDPVTGETIPWCLFNAALTNVPFMKDKMVAVAASLKLDKVFLNTYDVQNMTTIHTIHNGGPMDPKKMMEDCAVAMGLPPTATPEEVVAACKKCAEFLAMLPGAPAAGLPTDPSAVAAEMQASAANSAKLTEVAALLKCEPADVLANVASLRAERTEDKYVSRAEFDALSKQLAERKADELMAANAKKIAPVDRDFWRSRAIANHDDTKAVLAKMPDILPGDPPAAPPSTNENTPDDFTLEVRRLLNTTHLHKEA